MAKLSGILCMYIMTTGAVMAFLLLQQVSCDTTTEMDNSMHNDMDMDDMRMDDDDMDDMDMDDDMDDMNMDDDMDDMNMNGMNMDGMHMWFVISTDSVILFRKWVTHDTKSIGLACLFVALFAVAYECLKVFRDYIYSVERKHRAMKLKGKYALNGDDSAEGIICSCQLILPHLFQTILHMVQVFMSLILMLVFMTFNFYLCIAVVGGAGVGYLILGWKKSTSSSDEHCN